MAEQADDVTGHRIHIGLVVLVVEFEERLFPRTPALGQKGVVRDHVFVVEESDGVEQVDRLDKDPALDPDPALVLECGGIDPLVLGTLFLPLHNLIGVGEARVFGLERGLLQEGLEARMVSLEMTNSGERGPGVVLNRARNTGPFQQGLHSPFSGDH